MKFIKKLQTALNEVNRQNNYYQLQDYKKDITYKNRKFEELQKITGDCEFEKLQKITDDLNQKIEGLK